MTAKCDWHDHVEVGGRCDACDQIAAALEEARERGREVEALAINEFGAWLNHAEFQPDEKIYILANFMQAIRRAISGGNP